MQRRRIAARSGLVVGSDGVGILRVDPAAGSGHEVAQRRHQAHVAARRGDGLALAFEDIHERHAAILRAAGRLVEHVLITSLPQALAGTLERRSRAASEAFEPRHIVQIVARESGVLRIAQPFRQARRRRQRCLGALALNRLLKYGSVFLDERSRRDRIARDLAEFVRKVQIAGHLIGRVFDGADDNLRRPDAVLLL